MIDNETKIWVAIIAAAAAGVMWGGLALFGLAVGAAGL